MNKETHNLIISIASRELGEKTNDLFFMDEYEVVGGINRVLSYTQEYWRDSRIGDKWIFSHASDEEAKKLMVDYITSNYNEEDPQDTFCVNWDLSIEFSRLIAEKGYLIKDLLNDINSEKVDKNPWSKVSLIVAGIHHLDDGVERAIKMLDIIPEDGRDGIFMTIWYMNDRSVNEKLMTKFNEWIDLSAKNHNCCYGGGTGEFYWLEKFTDKWITTGMFSINQLEKILVHNSKFRHNHI